MGPALRRFWPLLVALAVLMATTAVLVRLALANLVLLAASYLVFGINQLAPFILNLVLAGVFLAVCHRALRRFDVGPRTIAILLLALLLCMPVAPVLMGGLEHFLHASAAVAFLTVAATRGSDPAARATLGALAAVMVAGRYEGLFLVAAVAAMLLRERRWRSALVVTAAASVPVVSYGIASLHAGWWFLPSSVLLKGRLRSGGLEGVRDMIEHAVGVLYLARQLLLMLVGGGLVLAVAYRRFGHLRTPATRMMSLTLAALILHLLFARVGAFYRYEAYLVAMWIVALGVNLSMLSETLRPFRRLGYAGALMLALAGAWVSKPLLVRGLVAHAETPLASRNIYEQQIQMATFLREHYPGGRIVANDIGAINYFADIDNLDLVGLGTLETMKARLAGKLDSARIEELARARGMQVAFVYDEWFEPFGGMPQSWTKVEEWAVHGNVVLGSPKVAIYAVTPAEIDRLVASLRAFAPRLPATVDQTGLYTRATALP